MDIIIKKIRDDIQSQNLFSPYERLLICVSGGADSVFLLNSLFRLKEEYKWHLFIAHVNHCLRGKDSDADEEFVRKLSEKHRVPFFKCKVDVARVARDQKLSLEDAARQVRYNFFINVCRIQRINKIVLAHTKDDQAETVLMRILRGTGMTGLGAMKVRATIGDIEILRPLLEIEKVQIIAFLKKNKIKTRTDFSNFEKCHFRNRIRLDLFPLLEKYNLNIKENLIRISKQAREFEDFFQKQLERYYLQIVSEEFSGRVCLDKSKFLKIAPVLRKGLIRKIIKSSFGDLKGVDFKHIQIAEDFIKGEASSGKCIDLPKNIYIKKGREHVYFQKKKLRKKKRFGFGSVILSINKKTAAGKFGFSFSTQLVKGKINLKHHSRHVEYFDLDKLKFPLKIRTRKSGDWFCPLGVEGKKKLKKFFIDEKIEDDLKNKIPLVISDKKIVWVVGVRIADNCKVTKHSKRILKISAKKISKNRA